MYQKINNIPVWGTPLPDAVEQMALCAKDAAQVALMADHHLGYSVPIGGVVAYRNKISPSGVGYDIACGNKAVRLDADAEEVRRHISTIMDDIFNTISFGVGRKNRERADHELFDDPAWKIPMIKGMKDKAREQLGTVGSGNHFVDIFIDEKNRVWVGVHFGSRGLGHGIASHFIKIGGGKNGIYVPPVIFDLNSPAGQDYYAGMMLAGRYAYAGRDWVCAKVAELLGARIVEEVHNHHNFAWIETHHGDKLVVVRKGATPAFPGQKGFVGGTMGDISVILQGKESSEGRAALYSTVHGAGRIMSRTEAAGSRFKKKGRAQTRGKISRQMMMDRVHRKGVELRGADTDESPHCYKNIEGVLDSHRESVTILEILHPIGVAMAGPDVRDPYKD